MSLLHIHWEELRHEEEMWGKRGATSAKWKATPRKCWRDYISHLAWERLTVPQEEMEDVAGGKYVWAQFAGTATQISSMKWIDKSFFIYFGLPSTVKDIFY